MWFLPYDITILIVAPAFIFTLIAQFMVSSTFSRYSKTTNRQRMTGADAARVLLEKAGIYDVKVEQVAGNLTDHYDPRTKVLRLSQNVYGSTSLAALGVAAHETGHAVQHNNGYLPLEMRNNIVPLVSFSSNLSVPLIFIGFFLSSFAGDFGMILVQVGIILFALVVAFQLITLPVEFNASKRAVRMLEECSVLDSDEMGPAKKVLNAAAMTYVASAAVAISQLVRFILLASRNNRD